MTPRTAVELVPLEELDDWMTANYYPESYTIGNRIIHEGYGLFRDGNAFVWFYTERGVRDNLHFFKLKKRPLPTPLRP